MATRPPLLLIGPGGHALSCVDVIEREGTFAIAGLVGRPEEQGNELLGYRVIAADDALPRLVHEVPNALITVGHIRTPEPRVRLFELASRIGYRFPVVVSPKAVVSPHAEIGEGTIVLHGAVVNAGARIGKNCIVNSLALVEHGVQVGDHCHISTSAAVNSGVTIGSGTFIGSGSTVRQCITIGAGCLVGMGEAVHTDLPDGTRVSGRKSRR